MYINNLKILFVLGKTVDPTRGGVSRVADNLSTAFAKNGAVVYAVSTDNSYKGVYKESWLFPEPKTSSYNNSKFLVGLYECENFDVIIVEDPQESWIIDAVEPLKGKALLIGHFHNSPYGLYSYISRLKNNSLSDNKFVRKLIFRYRSISLRKHYHRVSTILDKMIVLSESYRDELNMLSRFDKSKVEVIANPFPHTEYYPYEKERIILYVGRIANRQKRVFSILDIWKEIYLKLPDWKLIIVGDGPQLKSSIDMAKDMKLDRIYFEGHQNPIKYYEKSTIFVMTSLYEGFPMTVIEAMQRNCIPVLFNSFGAAKEIVDDRINGFLIKPFSNSDFANCIYTIAMSQNISDLQISAYTKTKQFEQQIILKKWITLLSNNIVTGINR